METQKPAFLMPRVGDLQLEVRHIEGAQPAQAPLVFLHEGLGSVKMWGQRGHDWPQTLCRTTGRTGWVYSRPGYGESDPIPDVRGSGRHRPCMAVP